MFAPREKEKPAFIGTGLYLNRHVCEIKGDHRKILPGSPKTVSGIIYMLKKANFFKNFAKTSKQIL